MKREDIIVWGSFLLSLCVILCQIQGAFSYDLWVDEAFSIRMLEHSYGEMIALTAKDVHPPLYYIILKATPHNTTPTKENILGAEQGQGCALKVFARTN